MTRKSMIGDRKMVSDLLYGLNAQQQQAVMAGLGPVLVLAGPGSGKTRVLTHRIAYLIGSMGVRPYQILAVTFTNKAAREMESRVTDLLGGATHGLSLGTFHAVCARLLRREADHLPFKSNFIIFDADDQVNLVKQVLKDLDLDEKLYRPHSVHAAISRAKNELYLPETYPIETYRDEKIKQVYEQYQQRLLVNNGLDFDDLLLWTAQLLEENPAVREKYARRYEHVLVDEFQDTNMAQYRLLKHLASFHNNIFVVGDTDQSIYRWRGADYRNVLRFEEDFPETQVIMLEQNYRSTQNILDVAMQVIDRNPQRRRKELFTDRGRGEKIMLHEVYDDRVEASFVVDTIAGLIASEPDLQPGDFAVMYRTNAQSRLLEEAFLAAGLPYRLVGAQRFYGRREVKDVIAYLRLIHNPSDEFSLNRIISTPPRGIGDKTLQSLRTVALRNGQAPSEALIALGSRPETGYEALSGRARSVLADFGSLLAKWVELKDTLTPLTLMDRVLDDIDYQSYIDDGSDEGQDRWENVLELRRLAAEYNEQGLDGFLEQVALVSDQDTIAENLNAPTLLTLHAAKGLEFPIVFIVGLNDGTLPHSRSFDDSEGMMEERRLFYVGITRAKNRLYLVYAQNRSSYGLSDPAEPSRFLDDLMALEQVHADQRATVRRRRSAGAYSFERWEGEEPEETRAFRPRYHPGMRVEHPIWHEGMVLNSQVHNDDEIVDVFFEKVGLKRVAASLAKLEILS